MAAVSRLHGDPEHVPLGGDQAVGGALEQHPAAQRGGRLAAGRRHQPVEVKSRQVHSRRHRLGGRFMVVHGLSEYLDEASEAVRPGHGSIVAPDAAARLIGFALLTGARGQLTTGHKIEWMRRESATVVVLIGDVDDGLLTGLGRSPNVSVARAPESGGPAAEDDAHAAKTAVRAGWEPGALAMREAARRRSTYVIVPDDPLAAVAADWHAMWDVSHGAAGPAEFERSAAEALAAWRGKQFELPDYYLVTQAVRNTQAVRADRDAGAAPDMYLGPLRAVRPRRIAVAGVAAPGVADSSIRVARVIETLRSLEHGPWWPPLDDLLEATRGFYAGGLAEIAPTL